MIFITCSLLNILCQKIFENEIDRESIDTANIN